MIISKRRRNPNNLMSTCGVLTKLRTMTPMRTLERASLDLFYWLLNTPSNPVSVMMGLQTSAMMPTDNILIRVGRKKHRGMLAMERAQ